MSIFNEDKFHKHDWQIDIDHIDYYDQLKECFAIEKYAMMINKSENIRLWDQQVLEDTLIQCAILALLQAIMIATNWAA